MACHRLAQGHTTTAPLIIYAGHRAGEVYCHNKPAYTGINIGHQISQSKVSSGIKAFPAVPDTLIGFAKTRVHYCVGLLIVAV